MGLLIVKADVGSPPKSFLVFFSSCLQGVLGSPPYLNLFFCRITFSVLLLHHLIYHCLHASMTWLLQHLLWIPNLIYSTPKTISYHYVLVHLKDSFQSSSILLPLLCLCYLKSLITVGSHLSPDKVVGVSPPDPAEFKRLANGIGKAKEWSIVATHGTMYRN